MYFRKIKSVSNLVKLVSELDSKCSFLKCHELTYGYVTGWLGDNIEFWFRGESDKDYFLCPKAMRGDSYSIHQFDTPLKDFTMEAYNLLSSVNSEDKLALMQCAQHYGVPTRLLDFSTNYLIALWFACQNLNNDGQLWILVENIYKVHVANYLFSQLMKDKGFKKDLIKSDEDIVNYTLNLDTRYELLPYPVKPNYSDNRMLSQSSRFLLWGYDANVLQNYLEQSRYISIKNPDFINQFIYKCIIPKEFKGSILKELEHMGIHEGIVFPDLYGIGMHIDNKYKRR